MTKNKARRDFLRLLTTPRTRREWDALLQDLLTPQERDDLEERWQLVQLLARGVPQRTIVQRLHASFTKVTRGSRVLQYGKGGFWMALQRLGAV